MSRWPMQKLKTLLEVQSGFAFKTECFSETSGIPLIRIRDISKTTTEIFYSGEFRPEFLVERGDYLIGMDGNFRCFEWQGGQALLNQRVCRLRNFSADVEPEYIYFGIEKKLIEIEEVTSFATVKHISAKQILDIEIPLPPLTEQRRIVDLLNHAAGIRRLRQQALETARALIPALFVKMFGDPARNEKGWEMVELGQLITRGPQNGLYKHVSAYGEGTPILRIDAFYDGVVTDISALRRLRLTADEIERYGLAENDIVINRVNSPEYLGKTAIVPALPEPTVFESNMMRFSVGPRAIDPRFLIQYLQTGFIKQQILGKAKHAINQSSINQQDVKSFPVMVPSITLQQIFATRVADLNALITQQERHLAQAEALLQSLMARFFGGSLECGDTSPLYQSADMSAHSKEPIENAVVPAHSKTTPRRRFDSADIFAPSQIAAEAPAAYRAGGQAALPAANQPVPARILAAMALDRDYSRAELLAATGISTADWTGAIRQLKEEGKVRQTGEKRGARYQLAKKGGRR